MAIGLFDHKVLPEGAKLNYAHLSGAPVTL